MKNIKCIIMDVDGTLTDGKIYVGENGEIFKAFNVKDGCGIHDLLIPEKILPVIITGRKSKILEQRCNDLGVKHLYQGITNKLKLINRILPSFSFTYKDTAYIGDDINDLECMEAIHSGGGIVGCPADAVVQVAKLSDFISVKNGGDGAVREFIEWIFNN